LFSFLAYPAFGKSAGTSAVNWRVRRAAAPQVVYGDAVSECHGLRRRQLDASGAESHSFGLLLLDACGSRATIPSQIKVD